MGDENLTEGSQCLWAIADVSKGHTPVDEFSRLFDIRILFQDLSDIRGKLCSYKIVQISPVLLMYFSLKNLRNTLDRAVPYISCILLYMSDFYL